MTTTLRCFLPLLLAALSLAPSARAAGQGNLRLEVLVDGRVLTEMRHDGSTYVEARRGREYALRVTNLEPVRVAVAVSVDGRNVIDAQHATAREARKWVLGPWQSIVLDGWQVSGSNARRFFFTTEARSYAQWLGDSSQAGVIEAIAFREQQPSWWSSLRPSVSSPERDAARDAAPPAPAAKSESALRDSAGESARSLASPSQEAASNRAAATGIGSDVRHDVVSIEFDHESQPCGSARIRYGYRDELVDLGIMPRPLPPPPWPRREQASGFERGPFCPAP